jgi:hypothetical protein
MVTIAAASMATMLGTLMRQMVGKMGAWSRGLVADMGSW